MTLPKFYHDHVFSVAETAEMAGLAEAHFRTLLVRAGGQYIGLKQGARLTFSAHEVYLATIAAALVSFGFSPEAAFRNAHDITGRDSQAVPDPDAGAHLEAERPGYRVRCNQTSAELGEPAGPVVVLPLASMWRDCMAKCRAMYAKEAA